ncbi:MAG: hypothetical protein ACYTHJ_21455 [Planctomycetota bacterium]|jgi:hypothetical protein
MARPKRITLSPAALDRNGVSTAQSPGAGGFFTLDGTLVTAQALDRNGIAASQTPAAAGALTLNGALPLSFPNGTPVTVYGGSDESGKTFTVKGRDGSGNIIWETITGPNNTTVSGTTPFWDVISVSVSAATTGAVEIGVPGIASFATPQHVTAYAAGNEATDTITIYGENRDGEAVTDTITGVNASTVASTQNFSRVYAITTDGAVTNMEIGVDGTCEGQWVPANPTHEAFSISTGVVLSASANLTYSVQHTYNDVFASSFDEDAANPFNHATLTGQTATANGTYDGPVAAVRLIITAHTAGTATLNMLTARG